jgi:hypothetical protein
VINEIIKMREENETTNMLIREMKGPEDGRKMTFTDRIRKGL